MRLDGQGQDRGRTAQGPSRVARLPGEPPSRSQECAINWPNPPGSEVFWLL